MTDKKLTDKEIKELIGYKAKVHCELCDIKDVNCCRICIWSAIKQALDYIDRLEAENERLKEEVKEHIKKGVAKRKYDRALIKAEAYKEFAKFLIDKSKNSVIHILDIPGYVREMEGENNDNQS